MKKILHKCSVCRRFEGRPYQGSSPPPLPDFRVQESPPFAYTGVDFAGPLFVKPREGRQVKVFLVYLLCGQGCAPRSCS